LLITIAFRQCHRTRAAATLSSASAQRLTPRGESTAHVCAGHTPTMRRLARVGDAASGALPNNGCRWTAQQTARTPDIQIDLPTPVRNTSVSMFQTFTAGIGGTCDRFQPAAGYWCSENVEGGGAQIYFAPIAMQATTAQLPNMPYKNATGAIIQTCACCGCVVSVVHGYPFFTRHGAVARALHFFCMQGAPATGRRGQRRSRPSILTTPLASPISRCPRASFRGHAAPTRATRSTWRTSLR